MTDTNLVVLASSSQVARFFEDVHVIANAIRANRFRNLIDSAERVPGPTEGPSE